MSDWKWELKITFWTFWSWCQCQMLNVFTQYTLWSWSCSVICSVILRRYRKQKLPNALHAASITAVFVWPMTVPIFLSHPSMFRVAGCQPWQNPGGARNNCNDGSSGLACTNTGLNFSRLWWTHVTCKISHSQASRNIFLCIVCIM